MRKSYNYWTKERLQEEALKYTKRMDFFKGSQSAYALAHRYGILNEICSHMIPQGSIYLRYVYKATFPDGAIYIGLTHNLKVRMKAHLQESKSSIYKHIVLTDTMPTFELMSGLLSKEDAGILETKLIDDSIASGLNILNRIAGGGLGCNKLYWTLERLKEAASHCKTRKEFSNTCRGAYQACQKMGVLDEVCSHMIPQCTYWTLETAMEEAKKYSSKTEFQVTASRAYRICLDNKVLDTLYPKTKKTVK